MNSVEFTKSWLSFVFDHRPVKCENCDYYADCQNLDKFMWETYTPNPNPKAIKHLRGCRVDRENRN